MAVIVVGGHTRNIGKTSVVSSIIAALPDKCWTAIKITQFGHNVCSAAGKPCDCQTADHTVAISEERDPATGTDSSRFLAAGAVRSLWIRTRQGQLALAMPRIRAEITRAQNIIIESNSILRFLKPDFYAAVLDPQTIDFKKSAARYLDRADALVLLPGSPAPLLWPEISPMLLDRIPKFPIVPPIYSSPALVNRIAQKIGQE